jgi:uncharacterized protein (TIGR02266 family)
MRILVVDDNQTYREILRGLLSQSGYEVETAGSAAEAVDTVRRRRPALALVDLYMPGGDGDALCRQLKADPGSRAMPVLMMSGGGRKDESQRCAEAGGDEFLVKPVRQAELLLAVSRHLHARLRNLRVAVRTPVVVETGGVQSTVQAVDLSLGGMFVETTQLLHPGTEVLLDFTVPPPAATPVLIRGEVAWLNDARAKIKRDLPVGMGLQFTKMTPEAQSALGRFLAAAAQAAQPRQG